MDPLAGVKNFRYSRTLFSKDDGSPIIFFCHNDSVVPDLKDIITNGGGFLSKKKMKDSINLCHNNQKDLIRQGYLPINFIKKCVLQALFVDPENYRKTFLGGSSPSTSTNVISKNVFDELFHNADNCVSTTSIVQVPRNSRGRTKYTDQEDFQMLEYIMTHNEWKHVNGNAVWQQMERNQVTSHTSQSMRSRFQKCILPNIDLYTIPKDWRNKLTGRQKPVWVDSSDEDDSNKDTTAIAEDKTASIITEDNGDEEVSNHETTIFEDKTASVITEDNSDEDGSRNDTVIVEDKNSSIITEDNSDEQDSRNDTVIVEDKNASVITDDNSDEQDSNRDSAISEIEITQMTSDLESNESSKETDSEITASSPEVEFTLSSTLMSDRDKQKTDKLQANFKLKPKTKRRDGEESKDQQLHPVPSKAGKRRRDARSSKINGVMIKYFDGENCGEKIVACQWLTNYFVDPLEVKKLLISSSSSENENRVSFKQPFSCDNVKIENMIQEVDELSDFNSDYNDCLESHIPGRSSSDETGSFFSCRESELGSSRITRPKERKNIRINSLSPLVKSNIVLPIGATKRSSPNCVLKDGSLHRHMKKKKAAAVVVIPEENNDKDDTGADSTILVMKNESASTSKGYYFQEDDSEKYASKEVTRKRLLVLMECYEMEWEDAIEVMLTKTEDMWPIIE